MSFPADTLLLCALIATSTCVVLMYFRMKRLDSSHAEYRRAFVQTSAALDAAREAMSALHLDGRAVIVTLGSRIDEANAAIAAIDARRNGGWPEPRTTLDPPTCVWTDDRGRQAL